MRTIVKCSSCGDVNLGADDVTVEIDFTRYVISYVCPSCKTLNEMHVQPSKKDLAQRQPLPGTRMMM